MAGSALAMAAPASAAEIYASLDGAGTARTWYSRTVAEVCDQSADNHDVAVEYYRETSASTLRTIWVGTGYSTCNSSGSGSNILKLRIREQMIAGEDRYGSWHY
ncbi:hypothetical protein [Streptomyces sp. HC307]|uniref:hypothetical protein n=1 Tax=Streptomyces flavusporus TaxID=3385496 RepID=UPI003917339F